MVRVRVINKVSGKPETDEEKKQRIDEGEARIAETKTLDPTVSRTVIQKEAFDRGVPLEAFRKPEESKAQFQERVRTDRQVETPVTAQQIRAREKEEQDKEEAIKNIQQAQVAQTQSFEDQDIRPSNQGIGDKLIDLATPLLKNHPQIAENLKKKNQELKENLLGATFGSVFLAGEFSPRGVKKFTGATKIEIEDQLSLSKDAVKDAIDDYKNNLASYSDVISAIEIHGRLVNELKGYVYVVNKNPIARATDKGALLEAELEQQKRDLKALQNSLTIEATSRIRTTGRA